jgi:hypothetical protein
MFEAWSKSPEYFAAVGIIFLGCLVVVTWAFCKNRGFRHLERMKAMELNNVEESFFAGRLLKYIPWQFWTSFGILLLLIVAFFLTKESEAQKTFLELTKYVTGAVIGSLFGSNIKQGNGGLSSQKQI